MSTQMQHIRSRSAQLDERAGRVAAFSASLDTLARIMGDIPDDAPLTEEAAERLDGALADATARLMALPGLVDGPHSQILRAARTRLDQATVREGALFAPSGPRALARLGLDVHAPHAHSADMYRRRLPVAASEGYFAALAAAIRAERVRAGHSGEQLQWIAQHLNAPRPRLIEDDTWARAWRAAEDKLGVAGPDELCVQARRVLLNELLLAPEHKARLTDALAAAIRKHRQEDPEFISPF